MRTTFPRTLLSTSSTMCQARVYRRGRSTLPSSDSTINVRIQHKSIISTVLLLIWTIYTVLTQNTTSQNTTAPTQNTPRNIDSAGLACRRSESANECLGVIYEDNSQEEDLQAGILRYNRSASVFAGLLENDSSIAAVAQLKHRGAYSHVCVCVRHWLLEEAFCYIPETDYYHVDNVQSLKRMLTMWTMPMSSTIGEVTNKHPVRFGSKKGPERRSTGRWLTLRKKCSDCFHLPPLHRCAFQLALKGRLQHLDG